MEVNYYNIREPRGYEKRNIVDGGVRLIKYKTDAKITDGSNPPELLELTKGDGWRGPGYYNLRVNLPAPPGQRELDAVIVIVKTSPNCYKITYSDKQKGELSAFKNYDEINSYLSALDKLAVLASAPTAAATPTLESDDDDGEYDEDEEDESEDSDDDDE